MKNFPDSVELTSQEIDEIRKKVSGCLTEIRGILFMSQTSFGEKTGVSRIRLSSIEHGNDLLTWSQVMSVVLVCLLNRTTAQYMFKKQLLPSKFFQFIQGKLENEPADFFWREMFDNMR